MATFKFFTYLLEEGLRKVQTLQNPLKTWVT